MRTFVQVIAACAILFACSEEKPKSDNISEIKEVVETEVVEENPQLETITDLEKIEELKKELEAKRAAERRAWLDSLSIAERLIENDTIIEDSIISLLKSSNTEGKQEFISALVTNKPIGFKIKNPAISNAIVDLIHEPQLERQMMRAIPSLGIPFNKTFEGIFMEGSSEFTSKYFYWLGKAGKSSLALESVNQKIKKKKLPKEWQEDVIFGLAQFSNSKSKDIKELALSTLLLAYKSKMVTAKDISSLADEKDQSEKARSFVEAVLKNGDEKAKSVASICLKNNIYVKESFKFLSRIKDPKVGPTLLKQMSRVKSFVQCLDFVPDVWKANPDSGFAINVLKTLEKQKDFNTERMNAVVNCFREIGMTGIFSKADSFLKNNELISKLKTSSDLPMIKRSEPIEIGEIAQELITNGILDSLAPQIIEEIESRGNFVGPNTALLNLLHYSKRLLVIDKIGMDDSPGYGSVVSNIQSNMNTPISQTVFASEIENNQCTLLFIGSDKAILAHPKYDGANRDITLFISALNEMCSAGDFKVLKEDPDQVQLFFGTESEFNSVKELLIDSPI